jgi:hypothetical protein
MWQRGCSSGARRRRLHAPESFYEGCPCFTGLDLIDHSWAQGRSIMTTFSPALLASYLSTIAVVAVARELEWLTSAALHR